MKIPPTGNKARIPGINIVRVAHGRIVEEHMSWDTLGLMNQLGLVPSRGHTLRRWVVR